MHTAHHVVYDIIAKGRVGFGEEALHSDHLPELTRRLTDRAREATLGHPQRMTEDFERRAISKKRKERS